jgi:putative transcriptional regulator
MRLSYKKLWIMLVERDLKKTEFAKKAKISSASLAKLGKGANVTTDVLVKICEELKCDIADICEIIPGEAPENNKESLNSIVITGGNQNEATE